MGVTLGLPHYKKCLRVHGKKVFRKILESLRLTFNGCLKTLHNEKLHYLHFPSIIIIIISSSSSSN